NVTFASRTRAGSGASNSGSMRTVPVNQSDGPLPDGCEPTLLISILILSKDRSSHGRSALQKGMKRTKIKPNLRSLCFLLLITIEGCATITVGDEEREV